MADLTSVDTLAITPSTNTFKILQLTDCHLLEQPEDTLMGVNTEKSLLDVLDHIQRSPQWPPDLILLTGDLAQTPTPTVYQRLHKLFQPFTVPCACLPGNHDEPGHMLAYLCQKPIACPRRILTRHWQILLLNSKKNDSPQGLLSENELKFLRAHLATTSMPTLIALHHPPVPVGSAWMDTMQLENGEAFLKLASSFPQVKCIIFGHVHQDFVSQYHSLTLMSSPSTCFQFKPHASDFALDTKPAGWRWLHLHCDGAIDTQIERLDHLPPGLDFFQAGY
ncbi:MAG: hypothetical protein AXA67_09860 [Methylothermaceae bacteria B42]|nr:MAG: hypothetical protein AXA67_09860 [Methylothermaceae bacteria B42]